MGNVLTSEFYQKFKLMALGSVILGKGTKVIAQNFKIQIQRLLSRQMFAI
jgi:hypothetical protein